jgi:AcrR family transcriptional regulator
MPKVVDIAERRAELAAAAAELIARAGVGAATLRDVAAEAGWTTGALTHYFADKRELLLFTFRSSLAQRHAAREARDPRRPKEALLSSLEGALPLDDARRRHWMVTVAFCAQAAGDEELSRAQRDAYRDFRDGLAELVRRGAGRRRDDAVARAERLIAVADGIAVQALFDPESWPPERQLATLHATVEPMMAR